MLDIFYETISWVRRCLVLPSVSGCNATYIRELARLLSFILSFCIAYSTRLALRRRVCFVLLCCRDPVQEASSHSISVLLQVSHRPFRTNSYASNKQ